MVSCVKARRMHVYVGVLLIALLQLQHVESLPPDFFRFGFVLQLIDRDVETRAGALVNLSALKCLSAPKKIKRSL